MCVFECCIADKSLHCSLLTWCDHHMKHPKEKSTTRQIGGLVNYQVVYVKHIKIQ